MARDALGRGINRGFIGSPGTGKTFAARRLVDERTRVVYIDPVGTMQGPGHTDPETVAALSQRLRVFFLVWDCSGRPHAEIRDGVDVIAQTLADSPRLETLVIDEWGIVAPSGRPSDTIDHALRAGRHRGISVWPVSQRAIDFSPDVRSMLDEILIFRQAERRDLEHLAKMNRELPAIVASLPDRHYILWDCRTGRYERRPPVAP